MNTQRTTRQGHGRVVTCDFPPGMISAVHLLTALTGAIADSLVVEALLRRGLERRGLLR